MNATQLIETLIPNATRHIELMAPPDGKFNFVVGCKAGIPMGGDSNQLVVQFQATGDTVEEALSALCKQVDAVNKLRKDPSTIAVVESNGRIRN